MQCRPAMGPGNVTAKGKQIELNEIVMQSWRIENEKCVVLINRFCYLISKRDFETLQVLEHEEKIKTNIKE